MNTNTPFHTNVKRMVSRTSYAVGRAAGVERATSVVLCYHSVGSNGDTYTVPVRECIAQIRKIQKTSRIVPLKTLLSRKYDDGTSVALTFDDGYTDFSLLLPFLTEHRIPATLFAISRPERADRARLANRLPLLNAAGIRRAAALGITIGSHSATHPDLTGLTPKELWREVAESKKELEALIRRNVEYFAYPNGSFTGTVRDAVRNAGYLAACTVEPGHVNRNTDAFEVPRIVVTRFHDVSEFPALYSTSVLGLRKTAGIFSKIWQGINI